MNVGLDFEKIYTAIHLLASSFTKDLAEKDYTGSDTRT